MIWPIPEPPKLINDVIPITRITFGKIQLRNIKADKIWSHHDASCINSVWNYLWPIRVAGLKEHRKTYRMQWMIEQLTSQGYIAANWDEMKDRGVWNFDSIIFSIWSAHHEKRWMTCIIHICVLSPQHATDDTFMVGCL